MRAQLLGHGDLDGGVHRRGRDVRVDGAGRLQRPRRQVHGDHRRSPPCGEERADPLPDTAGPLRYPPPGQTVGVTDSFPRRQARTRRFTLGAPRGVTPSPDGARVAFLRSRAAPTPSPACGRWTPATGEERLVADPRMLDGGGDDDLPPEERARRERAREQAGGIVAYATDARGDVAAFALSGRLYVAGLAPDGAAPRLLDSPGPVFDPRPDPTGTPRRLRQRRRAARRRPRRRHARRVLAAPDGRPRVTYGLGGVRRGRGDGPDARLLVVAGRPVAAGRPGRRRRRSHRWHIADPANPDREPAESSPTRPPARRTRGVRSSSSGSTAPAWTSTWDAGRVPVPGARRAGPPERPLLIVVQPRDQRALRVLPVDPATGAHRRVVHEDTDPHWVEIVPGVPAAHGGRRGCVVDHRRRDGARRLLVAGEPVTPPTCRCAPCSTSTGTPCCSSASDDAGRDRAVDLTAADGLRWLDPGGRRARRAAGRRDDSS